MGKGLEQTLLQGGYTEVAQTHEKMLNITSLQKDANLNHNEIPLHTSPNGYQINQQTSAGEVVEKREPSYTVGRNVDQCSHCGKQYAIS